MNRIESPTRTIRFNPRPIEVSPSLAWLLDLTFAKAHKEPSETDLEATAPEFVVELAGATGLAARLASRTDSQALEDALGAAYAAQIDGARKWAVAQQLVHQQTLVEVAEVAEANEIDLILLKGSALVEGGWLDPGERPVGDIDILVVPSVSQRLHQVLVDKGHHATSVISNEHHLPPLLRKGGTPIDIHTIVRGLTTERREPLSAQHLLDSSQVQRHPTLPRVLVPVANVLTAHCLAHAIDQHGLSPRQRSTLRWLVDLEALLGAKNNDFELDRSSIESLLATSVSREEFEAALALSKQLGSTLTVGARLPPLLAHFVLAATEPKYLEDLTLGYRWQRVKNAYASGDLLRYLVRKFKERLA